MRLKPRVWFLISLLLFVAAICTWQHAEKYAATHQLPTIQTSALPLQHPPLIKTAATNGVASHKSYRISNTTQTITQLLHNNHALILRNALIDTEVPVALNIPAHLRAKGAPGSYLVQADRPLDKEFYAELSKSGATYVSYVPNNAALVQASPEQATNISANADVVAVLPYEPYYKLDNTLLPSAVEQQPQTNDLSVTTFPGQRDAAMAALTGLGAKLIGEDRSPFGPTLIVSVPSTSLVAVAQLPLAQEIEVYTPRRLMNDLTRVRMGVAANTLIGTSNYLGLTGAKVTVNINDSGVDSTHPDFSPASRLLGDNPSSLTDADGHGTHVAGIIAGNGSKSTTVGHPIPGSVTNADFRGKATNATLFVQALDLAFGPFVSDSFLQENASSNLGPTNLISNNSWSYGSSSYDIHAAGFDAATRDAQPNVDGEQSLLFVFAAGNNGNGSDDGISGTVGTILSPGTAKNVITVGASDSPRFITNKVSYDGVTSNAVFLNETSNSNLVAFFSSCGNVSGGVEGNFGRFKPDVVAPGVFTISCRATNYVDPTNETFVTDYPFLGRTVQPHQTNYYPGGSPFFLPSDTSGLVIVISSNAASPVPFPTNMSILANTFTPPTTVVSTSNFYSLTNFVPGSVWFFGVAPPANQVQPVEFDLNIYLFETNYLGNYYTILSNMNNVLKPYYRYESGTSMSAGAVSGMLALMQEFLQTRMNMTNPSPALLKAMLINGSRSLGSLYDFNVNTIGPNEQGWGLPNLPNSIPRSLTNAANQSMLLVDQSPGNALATGQYQTYTINCADTNSALHPLRITLVWTDPPGDPAAGIALVNNLDLTVADATGSNIYIGNDFLSGDIFTEVSSPSNLPPGQSDNAVQNVYVNNGAAAFTDAGDSINNVQNVYINPANRPITFPLTVTISGTRVNVNAVPGQTNNIAQDYALVISSDDLTLSNSLTIVTNGIATVAPILVTVASNGMPLLHQRVGANEPNLYYQPSGSTNGNASQWHFFIFTNNLLSISNATNVAFATFLPPNLSIPRVSGSADVDLYVYAPAVPLPNFANFLSTPANLGFFANSAVKSVGRTGTESIIFTNSMVPVYYIGVKSEDQQAADFGFYGVAQQAPFSSTSTDGNTITATGTGLPVFIPNSGAINPATGSPGPALVFAFMFDPNPLLTLVRRATVTLGIQEGNPSELIGTLQHNSVDMVLNNNSGSAPGFTNTYDDLQENPNSSVVSDGPGSLAQYVNQQASGLWLLTEANSDLTQTGYVTTYNISVDLQQPQLTGFFATIPGQTWFNDFVAVPNDATNLIISALYENNGTNLAGTGPIGIYLTNNAGPITTNDYGSNGIVPPGGFLSLGTNNPVPGWPGAPSLAGGLWYYGIYNSNTSPVTLFIQIQIQESLTPNLVQNYTNNAFIPLTTDAHTQSQLCISNGQQVVAVQVGVRITDTNLDDLVLHLTSPQGTSALLFEDRGGTNATDLGQTLLTTNGGTNVTTNYVYTIFTENTNLTTTPIKFAPPPYASHQIIPATNLWSNSFETVSNGVYTNGSVLEGWLVTSNLVNVSTTNGPGFLTNNEVGIVTESPSDINYATNPIGTNYLALTSGHIVQTFPGTNNFAITNGQPYELIYYARPIGITNWWTADNNLYDIIGGDTGTIPFSDVNYVDGEVDRAWSFNGGHPGVTISNEVDFGTNAGNFGTNDFSVDFWIKVSASAVTNVYGVLEKRHECGAVTTNSWDVRIGPIKNWTNNPLHTPPRNGAVDFEIYQPGTTEDLSSQKAVNDGLFHYVTCTRTGTALSIYIDGNLDTNMTTNIIVPLNNSDIFRAGQSLCDGHANDGSQPFQGDLDELSLYNRALSPAEVYAIYHAGSLGKYSTNSILPNFDLTIDGVLTNNIILTNASGGWQLFTNSFIAASNQITVEFSGNPLGALFDDIQLIQLPATNDNNYYLPEEPLSPFVGENPLGCWTLDVWDTRNDSLLPTNGALLSWSLQLTTSSTNVNLNVLTNEVPMTNTVTNNAIVYFAIDVPDTATYATNLLTAISGGPLTLLFNQNALPTGSMPGDVTLASGVSPVNTSTNILSSQGGLPPLLPGQRYFLGVLNTGAGNATFTLQVNFNIMTNAIIPLTNAIPYTNTIGTNATGTNGPEYYSFVVPTNAVMVTFQILNPANGEVDLYAREGLPLPGPNDFDYESRNTGTNFQFIAVTTNSEPVALPVASTNSIIPLTPTTWYLCASNAAGVNNGYTIVATVVTNGQMTIIALTNAIPYTNSAPPGYPTNLLYSFTVSNAPSGVEFVVSNLTGAGNVQLLADIDGFPTPDQSYAGSFNAGTAVQVIQIVPNAALPSLNGIWYLSVPNTSAANVSYTITAFTNFIVAPTLVPITWSGAVDSYWDILATSNWVVTATPTTPYPYQNGSVVTFDDTATGPTAVNLTTTLAPASVTVSNSALTYAFIGAGSITGAPLTKTNSGLLIIDNTTANNFTSVTLNGGTLQFGSNDANGSLAASGGILGTNTFTNGTLAFDRSDNPVITNIIASNCSLSQIGAGTLSLSGINTYTNTTLISNGTLVVDNTNALGAWTGGPVTITGGGTLDLGGLAVPNGPANPLFGAKQFNISGAGVSSNGAIVNNGPNQQQGGFENIVLNNNATIGGTNRWDIRNGTATLNLNGFTLTKTGNNQISAVSPNVASGNIVINQGILSFEATPVFAPSAGTITVNSGGLVGQNLDTLNSFTRTIVLNGGGTTNLSGGGATYLDAPIQLANNSSLQNGAGIEIFNGIISGGGGLINLGGGTNQLSAVNTYSGSTVVAQGTLALINNGSINNSTSITVNSVATLDVTQRVNHTLTLTSGQTLFDNGTVSGANVVANAGSAVFGTGLVSNNLTLNAGSTFSPGTAAGTIGALSVSGTATMGGTNYMEINKSLSPSNDVLHANSVVYGGTLIVTNLGAPNSFVLGDTFTLYGVSSSSGAFSSIILPPLTGGLAWANTFGSSGPGTLIVATNTRPVIAGYSLILSPSNVVFSGTNGVPGGQYVVLTSTKVWLPLTSWMAIQTNYFDSLGHFTFTNSITTNAAQFFILQSP